MVDLSEHSPLGGSGASRWMPCPGSVPLSYGIEDEDNEYSLPGRQAHALAEYCLKRGVEPWRLVRDHLVVDKEMADAVQVYLSAIKGAHPIFEPALANNIWWVEMQFYCPTIHEYFWGQADFVCLYHRERELHSWELKYGAGIVVEVEQNPQLMYYAAGVLEKLNLWDEINKVVLHVAQPRGFHFDGPIREWTITTGELKAWTFDELVPAMDRALTSRETASGEHCRFCPARGRACPQLLKDFDELEELLMQLSKKDSADELDSSEIGRFLDLLDVAKIAGKQASKTAFNRLMAGHEVPGRKLVKARTNRTWKDEVDDLMVKKFGPNAFKPEELKSPAQIEALPEGKKFTARHAYKPDGGNTLARDKDNRSAIHADVAAMFEDQTKKEKK